MTFLIGEGGWSWLERATYRGGIGFYYDSTWGGVLTYLVVGLICLFAIIGVICTLKFIFSKIFGRKKKEDPHQKWLRTGKM